MKYLCMLAIALSIGLISCSARPAGRTGASSTPSLALGHRFGTMIQYSGKNIYVAWIQSEDGSFIQNLGVCQRLLGTSVSVLPYWRKNVYPRSDSAEIDAVTSATMADRDFSLPARKLKDASLRKFVVYFEVDCMYDSNDWFADQPAVLYSANVDLDSGKKRYELAPRGWTRNESVSDSGRNAALLSNGAEVGSLQTDLRYIAKKRSGELFGEDDSERSALLRVKKVYLDIM